MKNVKIVLVAEWDGWCGACAAERPLVLTRTGRQRLRSWLTGVADDSRPLLLTCRLCGTGMDVPLERDDPPVLVMPEPTWTGAATSDAAAADAAPAPAPESEPAVTVEAPLPATSAALTTARQAAADAFGSLLAQRRSHEPVRATRPSAATPVAAPAVPSQRTAAEGGLAELQLLADGIDLLSSGRA